MQYTDKGDLKMVGMKTPKCVPLGLGAKTNDKQHRQTSLENTSKFHFLQIRKKAWAFSRHAASWQTLLGCQNTQEKSGEMFYKHG